ncbi:MAG TPA: hypothetical protein PLS29_05165 [Acidimicrobiales bacterium]|nr:MAG: hypothetical protein B7Z69_03850 [Actinobacteria bacterium 21-73-9]HQU26404.1 hypothetical protein [Acidimicrobiales bacterium]
MAARPLLGPRAATLLLGACAIVAATLVVGALHHAPTPSPRSDAAADARRALARDPLCRGGADCVTATVRTSALGATFVAVAVRAPGATCHLALVDFFDARRLVATSATLEPFSRSGAVGVRARGDGAVVVAYAVEPRAGAPCAAARASPRARFTYALQGGTVLVVGGRPPTAPARVVGSGGR